LTGFKVTHTKDKIKWEEGQLESFLDLLLAEIKSEPLNLIQQAQRYRVRGIPPEPKTLIGAITSVSEVLGVTLPDAIDRIEPETTDFTEVIPETIPAPNVDFVEKEITLNSSLHGSWKVNILGFHDPAVTDYFKLSSVEENNGVTNKISIQINLAHPFATQYLGPDQSNLELLLSFTACLAIALSLGKRSGAKSAYIISYLNEILRVGEN
jgi:hypothetical protein